MTSTSPVEESNGKAYVVGQWGKLGLGQRSRVTERSPMGRLTLWDQREAGTWVHRSRKEARSGTTEGVQREGLRCGINGKLGLGCTDLGRTVL